MTHETIATQTPCPSCGKVLDAATNADGQEHAPRPGALCVCWYCGEMLRFDDDVRPRELSKQEFMELPDESAALLLGWQRLIRARKHQVN